MCLTRIFVDLPQEREILNSYNGYEWDDLSCSYAALHNHLHVLKWLRENGCPWNKWTSASAARGGNLEMLQWLRENGWFRFAKFYVKHGFT